MRKSWNSGRDGGGFKPVATRAIIFALVLSFVAGWTQSGRAENAVWENLRYSLEMSKPWTLFTYPFGANMGAVLWFALGCWIIYQFLSDLERRLGNLGTALFFFVVTFLGGLGYFIGTRIFGPSMIPPSLNLPVEVVVFTWCLVNPTAQILLFAVIPVPTRVLMWLCAAAVVIEQGWGNPWVGLLAGLPLLAVWPYATDRVPFMKFGQVPDLTEKKQQKRQDQSFDRFMSDVKRREHERAEKERLRKLFEDSLSDEDEKKG